MSARTSRQARRLPLNNQFGPERLLMKKARELCVPSLKILASSPSGAFLDDTGMRAF
jgi:hypothetical protein